MIGGYCLVFEAALPLALEAKGKGAVNEVEEGLVAERKFGVGEFVDDLFRSDWLLRNGSRDERCLRKQDFLNTVEGEDAPSELIPEMYERLYGCNGDGVVVD